MMKRNSHIGLLAAIGISSAAGVFAATLSSTAIYSYAAEIHVDFGGLSISKDGDCSWSIGDTGSLVVDKYEIKLSRKSNGSWTDSYKTAKTSDSSYSFVISSVGQYKFKVRALFVGGDKSAWSADSDIVSVTSEDVQHVTPGSGSGSSGTYVPVTTTTGSIVYVPAGPGTGSTQYTSTTIGPDGKTHTYVYNSNGTVAGTVNGTNTSANTSVNTSAPGGTPVNANSGATSGWLRSGNKWTYRYANGTQPKNCWDRVGDKWYFFDADGYLQYGWVSFNGKWYYSDANTGEMKTGFNNINEKWYYFNESGIMQTGYITVDGKTYYMDQSGARVQSAYNPDGHQFDVNGIMIK